MYPAADCSVCSANPTTNFGIDPKLKVGFDPDTGNLYRSFIRFDTSSIPAGKVILSAVLWIDPFYSGNNDYSTDNFNVQQCTDLTWTELGITWNNAPNGSVLGDVITEWHQEGPAGPLGWQTVDISAQLAAALSAGGIGFRVKNSLESQSCFAWISKKSYTATDCSKLIVTYADSGTGQGWIDVPVVDAYIAGTYSGENYPPSYGYVVVTGTTLYVYNSSSSGRDVDQSFMYYNTALANLQALGLPVGATITHREARFFCNTPWSDISLAGVTNLCVNAAGTQGATVTLNDWDLVGSTVVTDLFWDLNVVGWIIKSIDSIGINLSGYTNIGVIPAAFGSSPGAFAILSSSRNTNGNGPKLRIYYTYNVAPSVSAINLRTCVGAGT